MTSLEIAALLKDYGPWGLCALLVGAVVYLHKGWHACQEARIADGRIATEALTRQASSNAEIATMMQALREGQVEIMRTVSLVQRDGENGADRVQERVRELGGIVADFGRRLDTLCRAGAR